VLSCLVAKIRDQTLLLVLDLLDFPHDIVNSEQVSFENDNVFKFNKWNIPRLDPKDIYTNSSWIASTFRSEYDVKTVE
jgi:hypothetical protein